MKFLFYFLSLPMIFLSSNWMMLFISLEFNLILLLWILKKNIFEFKTSFFFKYFLFQSINSLLIIYFLLFSIFKFSSLLWFFLILSKMGLPPFFFWFFILLKFFSNQLLLYLMIYQKFPFFILLMISFIPQLTLFFIVILSFSSLGIWNQFSFNYFFYFSSMNHSILLLLLMMLSKKLFLSYMMFYFFFSSLFLFQSTVKFLKFQDPLSWNFFSLIYLFFLLGLPPSPLFFLKLFLLMNMMNFLSLWQLSLVFLSTVLPMFMYFYYFIQIFLSKNKKIFYFKNFSFFFSSLVMFVIWLL